MVARLSEFEKTIRADNRGSRRDLHAPGLQAFVSDFRALRNSGLGGRHSLIWNQPRLAFCQSRPR